MFPSVTTRRLVPPIWSLGAIHVPAGAGGAGFWAEAGMTQLFPGLRRGTGCRHPGLDPGSRFFELGEIYFAQRHKDASPRPQGRPSIIGALFRSVEGGSRFAASTTSSCLCAKQNSRTCRHGTGRATANDRLQTSGEAVYGFLRRVCLMSSQALPVGVFVSISVIFISACRRCTPAISGSASASHICSRICSRTPGRPY